MSSAWQAATIVLFVILGVQSGHFQNAPPSLEQCSFVVGDWAGTFKGYPSARVGAAFESPGTMVARWGPQRAWIESEATTEIPGLGPYSAKVLVRFDPRTQGYDSFVVNTAGTAARYTGIFSGNRLVFVGDVGEMRQRVTYENLSPREMRFRVEESHDGGATYRPHSEILWQRGERISVEGV